MNVFRAIFKFSAIDLVGEPLLVSTVEQLYFGSYLRDYTGSKLQICRSNSSMVVLGNGGLN